MDNLGIVALVGSLIYVAYLAVRFFPGRAREAGARFRATSVKLFTDDVRPSVQKKDVRRLRQFLVRLEKGQAQLDKTYGPELSQGCLTRRMDMDALRRVIEALERA